MNKASVHIIPRALLGLAVAALALMPLGALAADEDLAKQLSNRLLR
jgi:hypothetical protein